MERVNAFDQIAPSSAAASSSSSGSSLQCDVFINHRGSDVKHKLASTIYHTLDHLKLRAFLDVEVLEAGDVIPVEIQAAMEHASLHIAIFSPNYAQSPWCLAELSFMLKTGTQIIPIFYYVDPSDLRWVAQNKGHYAAAFSQHQEKGRYSSEKLKEWMEALHDVSFRSGYMINDNSGDEGRILKNVVNQVVKAMKIVPLEVAKHPVGMEKAVENFERNALQSLQKHHNVKIEGIVGMGGSGKTSLAKELFNRKCSLFERCSFIFDVRAVAQKDLHNKQKKLLQDLGISDLSFDNVEDGKRILSNRLRSVRALIVLDDVDHIDQLDALLPNISNLGSDSLVIVTTRELGVLVSWDIYSIYKMPGLNDLHAMQLFCWHAFLQPFPLSGFEILVKGFLKACNGLPLSLKVLGGQLHGRKSKDYWEAQLNKISRILPADIRERLQVSFDALDKEDQEMFLDAACFLIGEEKSVAIAVWNGSRWSGQHGLETLVNKCLVEVIQLNYSHREEIRMHDHLRDLGRWIASTRTPCRYWSPQQILDIQKHSEERTLIRGINSENFVGESLNSLNRSRREFKQLKCSLGSEILLVSGHDLTQEIASLSEDLVWLRWKRFPYRNLRSWLPLTRLTVLQIDSAKIEELWADNVEPPLELIELKITSDEQFMLFPPSIGRLKHLKKIIFCYSWFEFRNLPEEFCDLQSLEHLKLNYIGNLTSLPARFGELTNLRHIDLSGCGELKILPVSFKHLIHLEFLDLSCCGKLKLRLDMLENLTRLENLNLRDCVEVKELPSQITNQVSLKRLHARATSLRYLPNDICLLRNLNFLSIGNDLLTSLPTSLGNLSSLTSLYIESSQLTSLPTSFGNLFSLTSLDIKNSQLTSLPNSFGNLSSLTSLAIESSQLTSLPTSFGNLSSLTSLDIKSSQLTSLPTSFGNLSSLTSLDIESSQLTSLPTSFGNLSSLTNLSIKNSQLTSLPTSFRNLSYLKSLKIFDCKKLKYIPHCICCLSLLRIVQIWHSGVRELPFGAGDFALHKLEYILLENTDLCEILISEDCCPNLQKLYIDGNDQLMEIRTLPTSVNSLTLLGCKELRNITCIGSVVNLRRLRITDCPELDELPNFAYLTLLKELEMRNCPKVSRIEGLQHCTSLEKLEAETSWEFPGIQSLEVVERLREMRIRCENMSAIKPCVQSMKECPCQLEIEGRVFGFVQPVLNSLEFPDLNVVEWKDVFALNKLYFDFPNFLCYFEEGEEEEENEEEGEEEEEYSEEGTNVGIAVFRQPREDEIEFLVDMFFLKFIRGRGMVVAGEEAKVFEAFHKILALLK